MLEKGFLGEIVGIVKTKILIYDGEGKTDAVSTTRYLGTVLIVQKQSGVPIAITGMASH